MPGASEGFTYGTATTTQAAILQATAASLASIRTPPDAQIVAIPGHGQQSQG